MSQMSVLVTDGQPIVLIGPDQSLVLCVHSKYNDCVYQMQRRVVCIVAPARA